MNPATLHLQFQGDSITEAGRDFAVPEGDRNLGRGYVAFASARLRLRDARRRWIVTNRGVSGNRVTDLAARWTTETLAETPDVLSVLIGVNDVWHGLQHGPERAVSAEHYAETYDRLLREVRLVSPAVRLLLGEPFLVPGGRAATPEFEHLLAPRRAIVRRLAEAHRATLVPYQSRFEQALREGFTAEDLAPDGVHPSQLGHLLMAETWLAAFDVS